MDRHLHIVSFNVPYPADYGGVIDVFSRMKALYNAGVKIHLHCFEYGRGRQPELDKYCEEVNYYKRYTGLKGFSSGLPYIVYSRRNKKLLERLQKDSYPILLEGIHCTYFLYHNAFPGRKIFVRLHNIEWEYYHKLSENEQSFFKRMYYRLESILLKKYEPAINSKAVFLAINHKDLSALHTNNSTAKYLPVSLPFESITITEGKGDYCLYHGNLSVSENEKAATWLCEKVFAGLSYPFIIAGKHPGKELQQIVQKHKNISLTADPGDKELQQLISGAQINILPSLNTTGIKIKLLNALFNGRHCIVNPAMVAGTFTESFCHITDTPAGYKALIEKLRDVPFTKDDILYRTGLLKEYNNDDNAWALIRLIY